MLKSPPFDFNSSFFNELFNNVEVPLSRRLMCIWCAWIVHVDRATLIVCINAYILFSYIAGLVSVS